MVDMLYETLTFSEASKLWHLDHSSIAKAVKSKNCTLVNGVDFRKSGSTWLITTEAMHKLYGIPGPR